ncbi:MAG: DUF481 domain-containing protein [Cyanothece sp. SIO1E1]|nr:DUF481 domain-containing protein [Cyanothece sp. SIO1E1]
MKRLFFFLLLIPSSLSAQMNESDSLGWQASLSLSGFYQAGNVETIIFRANSDVSIKAWRNWVFETKNSYVYQEFGKEKADEDILSLNFLNFNPNRRFYPLVLGFVSTNFRREIDLRYLFGAGISYQLLNEPDNWLRLSVTTEFEHTEFGKTEFNRSQYNGDTIINTFRGTIWLNARYELVPGKMILRHESYYQPSLERSSNFRWQSDLGLEFPIWKKMNLTMNYLHTFENIVIAGQKPEDRFVTVGFSIKS